MFAAVRGVTADFDPALLDQINAGGRFVFEEKCLALSNLNPSRGACQVGKHGIG